MQLIRKGLLPAALVAVLATSLPALASDHEDGPRGRVGKSSIARFVSFVIHALDEFSFPPPH